MFTLAYADWNFGLYGKKVAESNEKYKLRNEETGSLKGWGAVLKLKLESENDENRENFRTGGNWTTRN